MPAMACVKWWAASRPLWGETEISKRSHMAKKDYYEVLGIGRTASAKDVKQAYRRLARKVHPDVNKDPDAERRFKEVQEAYDVLSDPKKREMYDRFGSAAFDGTAGGSGPQAWTWTGGSPFGGAGGGVDLGDILEQMFAGRGGPRGRRGGAGPFGGFEGFGGVAEAVGGRDIEQEVQVSFEQAIHGAKMELDLRRPVGPDGRAGGRQRVTVTIPPGVADGSRIRLRGLGEPAPPGRQAGDLILIPRVGEHPYFSREGDDLTVEVPVTVAEALAGASIEVPTLDGPTTMKLPAGVKSGQRLRLRGKGVPHRRGKGRGDQFVRIRIALPDKADEAVLAAARTISQATGNPREGLWK
jgi:curved DNA-binding protein